MCDDMFVVTGGPGSGKTTLIEALARRGLRYMPEAGRAIIQDQVRIGGAALPWADRSAFAELMLGWELRSYHEASSAAGAVMMDRGIPDVMGYLVLCGIPVPSHVEAAAKLYRYNQRVFVAPYWEEIFTQDTERKQGRAEAKATAKVMVETYASLGYNIVELPRTDIESRADFVTERLSSSQSLAT